MFWLWTISNGFKWKVLTIYVCLLLIQGNECIPQQQGLRDSYKDYYSRTGGIFNTLPVQAEETTTQALIEENIINLNEEDATTTPQPSNNQESNDLNSRSTPQNRFNQFTFSSGQQQTTGSNNPRYSNQRTTATRTSGLTTGNSGFTRQPSRNYQFSSGQLTNSPVRTINSFGSNQNRFSSNQQTGSFPTRPTSQGHSYGTSHSSGGSTQFSNRPVTNNQFSSSPGRYSSGQTRTGSFTSGQTGSSQSTSGQTGSSQFTSRPTGTNQYSNRPSGQTRNRQFTSGNTGSSQFTSRPTGTNQYSNRPTGTNQYSNRPTGTNQFTNRPTGTSQFTNTRPSTGSSHFTNQPSRTFSRPTTSHGHSYSNTPTRGSSGQQFGNNRVNQGTGFNNNFLRTRTTGATGTSGTTSQLGSTGTTISSDTELNAVNGQPTGIPGENNQQTGTQTGLPGNNILGPDTFEAIGSTADGFSNTETTDEILNTVTPTTNILNGNINGPTRQGTFGPTGTPIAPIGETNEEGTNRIQENPTSGGANNNGNVIGQPQQPNAGTVGGNGNNIPLIAENVGSGEPNQRTATNGRQFPVAPSRNQNGSIVTRMKSRETGDNFNISASIADETEDGNQNVPDALPAIFGPGGNDWRIAPESSRPRFPNSNFNPYNQGPGFGMQRYPRPGFDQRPRPFPQPNQNTFQQNQRPTQSNQSPNRRPFQQNVNTNQGQNPFIRPTNNLGIGVPLNMSRAVNVNADCLNSNMKVNIRFNGSFYGLIYSSGYVHDPECIYINGTGATYYEFYIKMNSCGTLARTSDFNPQAQGGSQFNTLQTASNNYRWNTISVQYNPMIEEEWDQHFKVTCEMGQEYWKKVTFPVLDVNVATGSPLLFTTKPPECFMEIRRGFSLTGTAVSGPVTVGDPLTLIIYMRSSSDGFDISVNNCYAHNGANKKLNLIDRQGCPSQEKLISAFQGKSTQDTVRQTALSAFFKAFRFTGSPALYVECDVHMCKGSCPEQRCNWRTGRTQTRKKRSPYLESTKEDVEVSEKINLFQSIEVRQEGEDGVGTTVNLSGDPEKRETKVCIPSYAFAATIAVLSIVLLISTIISMCLCVRHRHIKNDSKIMKSTAQHPGFVRNPLARLS